MDYIVEMIGITKDFPGIRANNDISINLKPGEILALLGENGAGKSTLMSVLFGLYQAERGSIRVKGREVNIGNPNVANALGIGMVHQHFKLVHNFTVTQNIVLGREPQKFGVIDLSNARKKVADLSARYKLEVDPDALIEDISVGMQQRVEILKMLYRDAEVLILDEPTAVLTPQEIHQLMDILKHLQAEGKSIIIITHKLKEISEIADRCTVIRRGRVIGTVQVAESSESAMAEMMVGRTVSFRVEKSDRKPGKAVLSVEKLTVLNARRLVALRNFSLEVRAGEILGLAGVEGNGQSELVEAITGLRQVVSGTISINGKDLTGLSPRDFITAGLGHIPEDRQKRGLVLDFTLGSNLVLERYRDKPFSAQGFLNKSAIDDYGKTIVDAFDVRSGEGINSITRSMSGGNQQKAIVGRELDRNPVVLIASQPTRGLDVGSIEYIHKRIVEHRDKGYGVLLVSLELDEIMSLSDRIAVISHGELMGVFSPDEIDEAKLGLMMAGVRQGVEA